MKKILLLFLPFYIFSYNDFIKEIIDPLPERNVIPKIIHQIWIGPNPFPEKFKKYVKTWKENHPTWKYKLWTNKDIENFSWTLKDVFDKARNYGMKSDIWRYEILYQYGGMYVDVDFECIKPFDKLFEKLTFFATYMKNARSKFDSSNHLFQVNNALIGCSPGDFRIKMLLDNINRKKRSFNYSNYWKDFFKFSGPYALAQVLSPVEFVDINTGYCILPGEITHPFSHNELQNIDKKEAESYAKKIYPNCMAIHHHACSWCGQDVK